MKRYALFLLVALVTLGCTTPDTQPVIDSVLEWKKAEDEELNKHKQLLSVAKFDNDPVKNATAKATYMAAIDRHARIADQFANAIVNWSQRVGAFNDVYANQTLDRMIDIYIRLKTEGK